MNQSTSSNLAVIGFIIFVIILVVIIPYFYNSNIEHHDTRKDYCAKLAAQIASDKANHLNATILVSEIQLYHDSCSG